MVAFVTKKFYLDEMKIVCNKIFFVKSHPGGLGAKNCRKGPFSAIFHHFTLKTTLKEKFEMGLHVTLLNRLEDTLAIILSHI